MSGCRVCHDGLCTAFALLLLLRHVPAGWYADTEIVRNLTDAGRYNVCAEVAACLGLDTKSDSNMWRDRVMVEVTVAVMHSFKEAGMGEQLVLKYQDTYNLHNLVHDTELRVH